MDLEIPPISCFPTVGSMQGCYMAMMVTARRTKGKDKLLFIDPGFPPSCFSPREATATKGFGPVSL